MHLCGDPAPPLPPRPCPGVDLEGTGSFPLGEAKLTALGDEPVLLIDRLWVIAEEPDKGGDELDCRLRLSRPSCEPSGYSLRAALPLLLG